MEKKLFDKYKKAPQEILPEHEYEYYVNLTAKLLKRPYMQVCKMFEREDWALQKIKDRYFQVTKHNGDMPESVLWWWLRKKDKIDDTL